MIQSQSRQFGGEVEGNLVTVTRLEEMLEEQGEASRMGFDIKGYMMPKIEKLISLSLRSVAHLINKNNRKYCFQIFGYDVMFDHNYKPWVIECNMNPGFKPANEMQARFLPRMVGKIFELCFR